MKHNLVNKDGVISCTRCEKDTITNGRKWLKQACDGVKNDIHIGRKNKAKQQKFFEEQGD